jgi:hypothetical protein
VRVEAQRAYCSKGHSWCEAHSYCVEIRLLCSKALASTPILMAEYTAAITRMNDRMALEQRCHLTGALYLQGNG